MKLEIITTGDSSKTLHLPALNEQYHSKHGALTEANHVYIQKGLEQVIESGAKERTLTVFELGFGTGMNAVLTAAKMAERGCEKCNYVTIEPHMLLEEHYAVFEDESWALPKFYRAMHQAVVGEWTAITPHFNLLKLNTTFEAFTTDLRFDLIYYDAFGPRVQPDLWEPWALEKCTELLNEDGTWVSYCAKGTVRRGLEAAGLNVERLPGPPGKREMLRAAKTQ